jgi:hypothetical protein
VPFERVKRSNAEIPSGSIVDLAFQTATHVMFYRPMVASQDTAEQFGEDGMGNGHRTKHAAAHFVGKFI